MRRLLAALAFCVLPACSPSSAPVDARLAAQALANNLREGCVATHLELLLGFLDRIAPFCEAESLEDLTARATALGCQVSVGTDEVTVLCRDIALAGDSVTLHAVLEFIGDDGWPGAAIGAARSVRVAFDAEGSLTVTDGLVACTRDDEGGIILEGGAGTLYPDGCESQISFADLRIQRVADLPSGQNGVVFTAGGADLAVTDDAGPLASGSVAFVGRDALVALVVDGYHFSGDLSLDG